MVPSEVLTLDCYVPVFFGTIPANKVGFSLRLWCWGLMRDRLDRFGIGLMMVGGVGISVVVVHDL